MLKGSGAPAHNMILITAVYAGIVTGFSYTRSQLEIDDRYSSKYGEFDFDVMKFPNASHLMRSLHDRGFRVTTWITPFSNIGSPATAEGAKKGFWIADAASATSNPTPAYTKW